MNILCFKPKRKDNAVWAPLYLLRKPPIRHRNSKDGWSSTAFQLAIIVWDQARYRWLEHVNKSAWEAGPDGGFEQRARETAFARGEIKTAVVEAQRTVTLNDILKDYRQGKVPDDDNSGQYKMKRSDRIKLAYKDSNRETRDRLLKRGPSQANLTFTVTKYSLVKALGRANSVKNRDKVIPCLDELLHAVGDHPRLLLSYKVVEKGIELEINPKWFKGQNGKAVAYVTLKTPLPDKSHVLWLYAWLNSIRSEPNTFRADKDRINVTYLYRELGVLTSEGPVKAQRFFERTLEAVNQHIRDLGIEYIVQANKDISNEIRFVKKRVRLEPAKPIKVVEAPSIVEATPPEPEISEASEPSPAYLEFKRQWAGMGSRPEARMGYPKYGNEGGD